MHFFEEVESIFIEEQKRMEYQKPEDLHFNHDSISLEYTGNSLSPIAQYYIAPFIFWAPNSYIILPSGSIDLNGEIMQQLLCHFQNVHVVTSKGNPFEVRMENLKPASKEKFLLLMNQKKINPFIMDLYQFHGYHVSSGDRKIVRLISDYIQPVDENIIDPIHIKEFDEIWNFINLIYLNDEYVVIHPNMLFSDSLISSIAIKYFSAKYQEIYISIDNLVSRITAVHLIF